MSDIQRFFLFMAILQVAFGALHLSDGNYGWAMFGAGMAVVMLAMMLAYKEPTP